MYTDALTLRHAGGGEPSHCGLPTLSAPGKCMWECLIQLCDGCYDEKMFIYSKVYCLNPYKEIGRGLGDRIRCIIP